MQSLKCTKFFLFTANYVDREYTLPDRYIYYLKNLYASLTPTRISDDQWPPSATDKVFNLAMIKTTEIRRGQIQDQDARLITAGNVEGVLKEKEPIELKDILHTETKGKRKVVLLEGPPGCGKSTLSVFISQKWEEGELFTEYQLVILIRLRDPAV